MTVSASGVRIQGDDYQHLYAWYQMLLLLLPDRAVDCVEVESENAGNVDDVVVRGVQLSDYTQVKYSTDASHPITSTWFTTAKNARGHSPLQRFLASWRNLRPLSPNVQMSLFTNRVLNTEDPILRLRDGQRGVVGRRLAEETSQSNAGKQLAEWAAHAGANNDELIDMLSHLSLRTDQAAWTGLIEAVSDRMMAAGLRSSDLDVGCGVDAVRAWVKDGVRRIDRGLLETEIERRRLARAPRYATLLVEAIDHAPWPDTARVRLDWVRLFSGEDPRSRRQLIDPAGWSTKLKPEMVAAAESLKAAAMDRVVVRGYMRLPLWFLAGAELPDVRGYHVACTQRGEWWSSEAAPMPFAVRTTAEDLGGPGNEIAIGISVTNAISADVLAFLRAQPQPIARYVDISPSSGPSPCAIVSAEAAVGWALETRNAARAAVRDTGARKVHLFLSGPAGAALLLGHYWNRVAPTCVYEDLNPGYAPTYEIG